jgi:hypothetical protein
MPCSGGDGSGHCVDVFHTKKDVEEIFFVLGVRCFGRVGTIAIFFVTLA